MLVQRLLVAAAGIPLLLLAAYFGGKWFLLLTGLLAVGGLKEYFYLLRQMGLKSPSAWAQLGSLGLLLIVYWKNEFPGSLVHFLVIGFLLVFVFTFPRYSLVEIGAGFLGLLYVTGSLSHLLLLRLVPDRGFSLVVYAFVLTWANDTGAYFAGRLWGRKRIYPLLSPGKTWEGAIGGLLATLVVGLFIGSKLLPLGRPGLLVLPLLVALFAQLGDLIESGIKRLAQVKDSGRFLPGHGGILDRFDSLLLVAPVVYYFWILLT
ncbi:MAG: phosphatidate cytidylyltransferase [Moorellaceae bacterium]